MKLRLDPLLLLLVLLVFGATFMGGMIATLSQPLAPGLATTLASVLSGQELPTLSHAVLGVLIAIGCVWLGLSRKVVQLPQTRILAPLVLFCGLVGASVFISRVQSPAIASASEWILYCFAFLLAASAMGRKQGPRMVAGSMLAAIAILAYMGIMEWRHNDPSWRIFDLWTPNTQASVQIAGIFVALAILTSRQKETPEASTSDQLNLGWVAPLFSFVGLLFMLGALVLTGSKGGLLGFTAGLGFWLVSLLALQDAPKLLPWIGRLALLMAVLVCLVPGMVSRPPSLDSLKQANKPVATGTLSRLQNSGATAEQSVGFRKLLWISSYRIFRENPVGAGMGAFFYESARPGLITQTQTAHNTMLQLLVEAGPLALLALLAFLAFCFEAVMRTADGEPKDRARLRIGVTAAALALLFHSATESNLYSFGLGIIFFMLLAIAVQLSADAASPEFVPPPGKALLALLPVVAAGALTWKGLAEVSRANLKYALNGRDVDAAKAASEQLLSVAPDDAESWFLKSNVEATSEAQLTDVTRAIERAPLPRYFRAAAQLRIASNDMSAAQNSLRECFQWDPNNLAGHLLMLKTIDPKEHPEDFANAAKSVIAIEETPYFLVRSIPEIVQTETFTARLALAEHSGNANEKVTLLKSAVAGYKDYLNQTVPMVLNALKADPTGSLSAEPPSKAKSVMQDAVKAAKALADLLRNSGHLPEAEEAARAADEFAAGLANLEK